ncbi:MAG: DUF3617 domain-containing protein [Pseudomonadota bacterium]
MKTWLISGVAVLGAATVAAQTVDESMKPQPGSYESQITLVSADIPGLPANMLGMIKEQISRTMTVCLTPEEVEEGYKAALARTQDGECEFERFNASGGVIDAVMICDGPTGPMTMTMNGTGTTTQSDVTMNVEGDMGGGQGSMTMRVVQKRLGDC